MSQYDLIAFDMDGTLLNSDKQISPDSIEAIHKAALAGKHVVLSTGRCMPELVDILPLIPDVRYVIAVSGALVLDHRLGKIISLNPISEDTVKKMFKLLEGDDVMIHIHSDKSYVQRDKASRMADYSMGIYQKFFDRVATEVDNIESAYLSERFPVYKFNIYPHSTAERDYYRQKFSNLPLSFAYAETASLECSQAGISKASGLSELCSYLDIDISRTIAVGDSDNDLTILQKAGLSVAMGNSSENALSAADAVVKDNDHGGCAEAIYKYLL